MDDKIILKDPTHRNAIAAVEATVRWLIDRIKRRCAKATLPENPIVSIEQEPKPKPDVPQSK